VINSVFKKTDEEKAKVFKCLFCDRTFLRPQQLGGHQSKSHPG